MEPEGSETQATPLFPRWVVAILIVNASLFILFVLGVFWLSRQPIKSTQPQQTISLSDYDYVFSKGGKIYGTTWSGRKIKEQEIAVSNSSLSYSLGHNRQLLLSPFKHHLLYSDVKTSEIVIVDFENQQIKKERADNHAQYFLSPATNKIVFRDGNKLVRLNLSLEERKELSLSQKERLLIGVSSNGDFATLSSSTSGVFLRANLAKEELTSFSIASPSGQLPTPLDDGTILYPLDNRLNQISPPTNTFTLLAGTFVGKIARVAESPTGSLAVLWYTTQTNLNYSLSLYDRGTQKITDLGVIEELAGRREELRSPLAMFFLDNEHLYLSYSRFSGKSRPDPTHPQTDQVSTFGEGIYDLNTKQFHSINL